MFGNISHPVIGQNASGRTEEAYNDCLLHRTLGFFIYVFFSIGRLKTTSRKMAVLGEPNAVFC